MQASETVLAPGQLDSGGQDAQHSKLPTSGQPPNGTITAIEHRGDAPASLRQHADRAPPAEWAGTGDEDKISTVIGSDSRSEHGTTDSRPPIDPSRAGLPPVATCLTPAGQEAKVDNLPLEASALDKEQTRLPDAEEALERSEAGEAEEAGPAGRQSTDEGVGITAGRRSAIKPKDYAGGVVWAKLAKYPWWPAQVLDENDPWIPNDTEMPRPGAIPVRFFGTYDFAWIESQRAICPIDQDYEDHSSKSKQKSFTDALAEAKHFQQTKELPDGFNEDTTPSPQKAPKKGRGGGKGKGKRGEAGAGSGKGSKRAAEDSTAHRRSVRERQDSIMQTLSLVPPPDSPYSHSINLDGVRKLIELQKAGQYPPPAPQPVQQPPQAFPTQSAYGAPFSSAQFPGGHLPSAQFSGGQFSGAQFSGAHFTAPPPQQLPAVQSQQLQHLQQQLQAAGQGRPQWPLHFPFNSQLPLSFFQAQGGVQGALLAAASQGQLQPKQF